MERGLKVSVHLFAESVIASSGQSRCRQHRRELRQRVPWNLNARFIPMSALRTLRIVRGDITRHVADAITTSSNAGLVGNARPEFWRHRVPRIREMSMAATTVGFPRSQDKSSRDGTAVPYLNVDGQVHAAAGPDDPRYELEFDPVQPWRGALVPATSGPSMGGLVACLAGEAVSTPSFGALAIFSNIVIHAVAPDGRGPLQDTTRSMELLRDTYDSAIAAAHEGGASSLAIPSLGCGVNSWSPVQAAIAAIDATSRWLFSDRPGMAGMMAGMMAGIERIDFVLQSPSALDAFRAEARTTRFGKPMENSEQQSKGGEAPTMDIWRWDAAVAGMPSVVSSSSSSRSRSRRSSSSSSDRREVATPPPHHASDGRMPPSLAACVVETAADAVVHICPEGRVRTWNRGACEIFQLPASEAVGRDLTELITPPHLHHIRPLDPKPRYGRRHLRRAPAIRRDGSSFTAEFTVQPLCEEKGSACNSLSGSPLDGVVIVLRDASEMGQTVRKLRERVAEMEAAMQRLVEMAHPQRR